MKASLRVMGLLLRENCVARYTLRLYPYPRRCPAAVCWARVYESTFRSIIPNRFQTMELKGRKRHDAAIGVDFEFLGVPVWEDQVCQVHGAVVAEDLDRAAIHENVQLQPAV